MPYKKAAILGATGPTGLYIASELRKRGTSVRAVARNPERLARLFHSSDVEHCVADVTNADAARRAIDGCDIVFLCIGVPTQLAYQHRMVAHAVADAATTFSTRCVHVSSFWSFLPIVASPMTEEHPRQGGTRWMQDRREAEEIMRDAGAAIANLPDFYGPGVHSSALQQALFNAAHNKNIYWVGATDTPRAYCYLPDAAATLVRLAENPGAFGHNWLFPTAGTLTGEQFTRISNAAQGTSLKIRGSSLRFLNLLSLVNTPLRRVKQILPEYVKPLSFDATRLRGLLGPQSVTSYEEGIRTTLERYKSETEQI